MKAKPTNETRELVDRMLDGTIDAEALEKLEHLLRRDQEAMDYYLDMAGQEGLMSSALMEKQAGAKAARFSKKAVMVLLVSAALIVFAALAFWSPGGAGSNGGNYATVTDGVGVVWRSRERTMGSEVQRGEGLLAIKSGLLEITHRSGTRLLIEGPAEYEVTGPNSGRFERGKLVAEVPPGAEGFTVDSRDGRVVDIGTEFALEADPELGTIDVGVFRGEVKVWPRKSGEELSEVPLYTGHAVRMQRLADKPLRSIPFDQESFIRRTPSREQPWYHEGDQVPLEWDVSHLVWSDGDHLAVLKWMRGPRSLLVSRMELLLDGELVVREEHPASAGNLNSTLNNVYRLTVPENEWRRGKWTLRAYPSGSSGDGTSEGIMIFEDGDMLAVSTGDFVGVWEYVHDGVVYRRTFNQDGSCLLEYNGKPTAYFDTATWDVEDGILEVRFNDSENVERHILRDRENLIFINQPYRNAKRIE